MQLRLPLAVPHRIDTDIKDVRFFLSAPSLLYGKVDSYDVSARLWNSVDLPLGTGGAADRVETWASRWTFLAAVACTYPLMLVPIFEILEAGRSSGAITSHLPLATSSSSSSSATATTTAPPDQPCCHLRSNLLRTGVVVGTVAVAYLVPSFGLLSSLVGGLGSASLAFVVPVLIHYRLLHPSMSAPRKALSFALMAFGVVVAVLSTALSIRDLRHAWQCHAEEC